MSAVVTNLTGSGALSPKGVPHYGTPGDKLTMLLMSVALDNSYAAGGEVIDLSSYFAAVPAVVLFEGHDTYFFSYVAGADASDGKIKVSTATATEVAGATDLSAVTALKMVVIGQRA